VEALHSHGFIHRDLKAENFIFFNKDNYDDIKIVDLGSSIKFNEGQSKQMVFKEICGAPNYLAPEMVKRTGYNEKVDLWSVGVILH